MATKRKNPNDTTLRNLRAAKTRELKMAKRLEAVLMLLGRVRVVQGNHEARLRALEQVTTRK